MFHLLLKFGDYNKWLLFRDSTHAANKISFSEFGIYFNGLVLRVVSYGKYYKEILSIRIGNLILCTFKVNVN